MLQGGHERQPDRLACDREIRRIAVLRDEVRVGERLDPGRLGKRVQVRRVGLARRAEVHRPRAALSTVEKVEAHVRRDLVKPRSKARPALESLVASPRAQERLLHRVFRLDGAEHPVAVRSQLHAMSLERVRELGGGRRGGDRRRLHADHATPQAVGSA